MLARVGVIGFPMTVVIRFSSLIGKLFKHRGTSCAWITNHIGVLILVMTKQCKETFLEFIQSSRLRH
jgi:hypothetical protein